MTSITLIENEPPLIPIKTDKAGRRRLSPEHKEALLDTFESSSMSGAQFAKKYGLVYPTFASWVKKRRESRARIEEVLKNPEGFRKIGERRSIKLDCTPMSLTRNVLILETYERKGEDKTIISAPLPPALLVRKYFNSIAPLKHHYRKILRPAPSVSSGSNLQSSLRDQHSAQYDERLDGSGG